MRPSAVVVGRENAGKTSLVLRLAELAGLVQLEWVEQRPGTGRFVRQAALEQAQRALVSDQPHFTRQIQAVELQLPGRKGSRRVEVVDTAGLSPGIHPDPFLRRGMAQTLQRLQQGGLLLHVIDAARVGTEGFGDGESDPDLQLMAFGDTTRRYALVANKMDLPGAPEGLERLRQRWQRQRWLRRHPLVPVSCVTGEGILEVGRLVGRMA